MVGNSSINWRDLLGLEVLHNCRANKFGWSKQLANPKGRALNLGPLAGHESENFNFVLEGEKKTCCKVCDDGSEAQVKTWSFSVSGSASVDFHLGFGKYMNFGVASGFFSIGLGGEAGGAITGSGEHKIDECDNIDEGEIKFSATVSGKLGGEGYATVRAFGRNWQARAGLYGNISASSSVTAWCSRGMCDWKLGEVEFQAWASIDASFDAGWFGEFSYSHNLGGFEGTVEGSLDGTFRSPFQ